MSNRKAKKAVRQAGGTSLSWTLQKMSRKDLEKLIQSQYVHINALDKKNRELTDQLNSAPKVSDHDLEEVKDLKEQLKRTYERLDLANARHSAEMRGVERAIEAMTHGMYAS